ncbi:uncharacterized protein MELLADRAFT_58895 [Melampsora larici-populina 98AG31]|uniref:Adenosine deaminase domain-containing protein n=1 Tax=Melampsora larici-populina (strain 98AG31 / pathotype 3-4-7) TaxID=747676 RepID=F4R6B2_MELLP|nr:uncharacterized protein MELLADRAFT_58895 [Melampsora larici-populina 98AG31]EGG11848.1 hypothetical protein MELLADRAFT_58895 [Melampsora larici-populina 98AG31]
MYNSGNSWKFLSRVSKVHDPHDVDEYQSFELNSCYSYHAHLNGSIPRDTFLRLRALAAGKHPELASDFSFDSHTLDQFFAAFQNDIYKVTDNPQAVTTATVSVLESFEKDGCIYLELRTTPRDSQFMDKARYLDTVLKAIESYDQTKMIIRLLVSVDWRHTPEEALAIIDLAQKERGRGIVGIDVCGDPSKSGRYRGLLPALRKAKEEYNLKITVHFSEIESQGPYLDHQLRDLKPDRLGHATFLTASAQNHVIENQLPIEVCITSNLLTKTVESVEEHHVKWAVNNGIPVLISTDDTLLFDTTSSNEYKLALQLLGGDRALLLNQIKMGIEITFGTDEDKAWMRSKIDDFTKDGLECS